MFPHSVGMSFLDYFMDVMFCFDLIITFRTTRINKSGEEIEESGLIAKNYAYSLSFICDLLTCLQIHMIWGPDSEVKLLSILKVHVVSRFNTILNSLSIKEEIKALIKIFYYFVCIILYVHTIACIWFYVVSIDKMWLPIFDWVNPEESPLFFEDFMY